MLSIIGAQVFVIMGGWDLSSFGALGLFGFLTCMALVHPDQGVVLTVAHARVALWSFAWGLILGTVLNLWRVWAFVLPSLYGECDRAQIQLLAARRERDESARAALMWEAFYSSLLDKSCLDPEILALRKRVRVI